MKRLLLILSMAAAAAGCAKNYPMITNAREFGSLDGDKFHNDYGATYNIVGNVSGQEPPEGRVFLYYDIMRYNEDKTTNIRLKSWTKVLVKDGVILSTADLESMGSDPIKLESGSYSGGYLNVEFTITSLKDSETKHLVNLIWDDTAVDTADTLRLHARHNAYGESLTPQMLNADSRASESYSEGRGMASFTLPEGAIPEGEDILPCKLYWTWYTKRSDGTWESKESSASFDLYIL